MKSARYWRLSKNWRSRRRLSCSAATRLGRKKKKKRRVILILGFHKVEIFWMGRFTTSQKGSYESEHFRFIRLRKVSTTPRCLYSRAISPRHRSEERRVGKERRSRMAP